MTIPANSCETRVLREMRVRAQWLDSRQATHSTAVAPTARRESGRKGSALLEMSLSNYNSDNDIESRDAERVGSNSGNEPIFNRLREAELPVRGQKSAKNDADSIRPSTLARWLRFNFVGAIGIVVQFVTLFLLKSILHFHYLVATVIAVEAAVMHNFVWHERFTWADRIKGDRTKADRTKPRNSLSRLLRFNLANGAVSILGNVLLMGMMVGAGRMNYLAANGVAITLCSVANFLVSDAWVFEKP